MKTGLVSLLADEPVSHNARIRKRVIVRRGEVPHLAQIARATFPPAETAPAHTHLDMWELFICEEGKGVITVNGSKIALLPGTWVLVHPGDVHELNSDISSGLIVSVIGIEKPSC
jgi:quercetin dioxygenase-like cupin family protein